MERQIIDVMFSLLRFELGFCAELSDGERELARANVDGLYKLSKSHDTEHLVADALSRQGLLTGDGEAAKKLQKAQMLAIFRYERINYDYREICRALTEAGIEFLPLKGALIRELYPQPWMRTSCDIDILVREESLDAAISALTEKLSFTWNGEREYHDVSLFSPGGVHLELHFSILEHTEYLDRVLARVWDYTVPLEGQECERRMTSEFFMFHHLSHMAYHFTAGGCGIKPFLDIAVMRDRFEFDAEGLKALLDECGLAEFYESVRALTDVWFFGAEPSALTERMQAYILHGGVYGSFDNRIAVSQSQKGGKLRYILGRIFVPTDVLISRYPSLERRRWLMPAYQVRRWFGIVFCGRLKSSVQEIKASGSISKDKETATKELLDELGLK